MKKINELKIFISVDIEGVCGICNWQETELGEKEYEYFRNEMTLETVTCCNTLIKMGITNITVRDAHDSARNIIPNQLPDCVKLIRGWTNGPCDMMAGLDDTYDGIIFIGYHSPARSIGNPLSHTLTTSFKQLKLNNKIVSEYLLNTYYAQSEFNVPVIMVCGDNNLTQIAKEENSNIQTVSTNIGIHGAIITKHPQIIYKEIDTNTQYAIKKLIDGEDFMVKMPKSFTTEIQFKNHILAYKASFFPKASFNGNDKATHISDKFLESLVFIMFNE